MFLHPFMCSHHEIAEITTFAENYSRQREKLNVFDLPRPLHCTVCKTAKIKHYADIFSVPFPTFWLG